MRLDEDMHVHSVFSDGKGTLADNIRAAETLQLSRLGCVDHVRRDSRWVPEFAAAVQEARRHTRVELIAAVEAKLLNAEGDLDAPADLDGIDFVYAADHQFPWGNGCVHPREVKQRLAVGDWTAHACIEALVGALCAAMERNPRVVLAHMFSILPKVGLRESQVSRAQLHQIARTAARHGAKVEFDERWNCPGPRALRVCRDYGVEVLCSSDAHMPSKIGRYHRAPDVRRWLA